MHTITFKSDDEFYNLLEEMVKSVNTTKSDLIRKSILYYQSVLEKEQLKAQIKQASLNVRNDSLKSVEAFDESIGDGLNDV